jgi:NAD(P)-dependent dehydrogenase (short-subunit alcohol dehydrogenase family)
MGSLDQRIALVTGGTAGIGFHTALGLARGGERVLVTARDERRGSDAVSTLRRLAGHDAIELLIADASSTRANVGLAESVSNRLPRLDILVNNAGGAAFPERTETSEGFEANLALNFIGPFALTTHLLPFLSRSPSARVINVVSSAFAMWKGDPFEDLESRQDYVAIKAHARAKLLNLLFTLTLARRLEGTGTIATAVNPGMAWTPGVAALTPAAVPHWRFIWPIVRWVQRRASPAAAARAPIFLATSPDPKRLSGRYFDGVKEKRLPQRVLDVAVQDRAWSLGESFVSRTLYALERKGGRA